MLDSQDSCCPLFLSQHSQEAMPPVLLSAAALLDRLFEHPGFRRLLI